MLKKHLGSIVCGSWILFLLILWPQLIFETPSGIYAGSQTLWSDWAAHFTYASHIANRPMSEWTENHPLFLGAPFNYPFVTHFFSAALTHMGFGPVGAHLIPSMFFTCLLVFFLFSFYRRTLNSSHQAGMALSLALLGGSLAYLRTIPEILESATPIAKLFFPPETLSKYTGLHFLVGGTFPTLLIPQRTIQLGLFLGFVIIFNLGDLARKPVTLRTQITLGLLWGVLPAVHIHSFLAVSAVIAMIHLFQLKFLQKNAVFLIVGALTATLVFVVLHRKGSYGSFLAWQPFWLAGRKDAINPVLFWWLNWSMFLPLCLLGLWRSRSYRNPFVSAGLILFVLVNFVRFQPWDWDNTKILIWSYMLMVPSVVNYLSELWRPQLWLNRITVIVLFIGMTLTGALDLMRLLHGREIAHVMFTREEIEISKKFKEILKPNDVILVSPKPQEWVSALAGGQLLLGYEGWLWTYGIHYQERANEVETMLNGGPDCLNLIKKYDVRYAVFSKASVQTQNEKFYSDRFKKVLESATIRIYSLDAYKETPTTSNPWDLAATASSLS